MATIRLVGARRTVECREGETVLQALQRSGFSPTFGCRRGGCAVCKVNVVEGSFNYNRPIADTVLTPEEREKVCLTCRAVPVTDLTIALDYDDHRPNPLRALYRDLVERSRRGAADTSTD